MEAASKISCIICAYNEEKQIGHVLTVALSHPLIDEVIVVNDGSTDKTRKILFEYEKSSTGRLVVHHHETNKGKSAAIALAISKANHELILFLDADLVGLTKEAITDLISPIQKGEAQMALSMKNNSLRIYKRIGIDHVSGERIYPKELVVPHLQSIASLPGFAVETYINELAVKRGLRIRVVKWDNVSHLRKADKVGFIKGNWGELRMLGQMLKIFSLYTILRQITRMRRLTKRT